MFLIVDKFIICKNSNSICKCVWNEDGVSASNKPNKESEVPWETCLNKKIPDKWISKWHQCNAFEFPSILVI